MFRMIQITLAVVTLVSFSVVAQAGSSTTAPVGHSQRELWQRVGAGEGWRLLHARAWGTAAPNEADSDGNAKLTLASGDHFDFIKSPVPANMVTGGGDYTMEFKTAMPTKSEVYLAWSENNSLSGDDWNHVHRSRTATVTDKRIRCRTITGVEPMGPPARCRWALMGVPHTLTGCSEQRHLN